MAGINEFMIFDENNQNSMTNETYSTDEQRLNGVASGIARSSLYNKALRQATKMSKELGLFLSQKGNDVTEDSDIAGMLQEAISKDGLGLSEYLYMTDAGIRSKDDWNYVSECNPGYAFLIHLIILFLITQETQKFQKKLPQLFQINQILFVLRFLVSLQKNI